MLYSHRGFTLIELIVSLVIFSILLSGGLYVSNTLLPNTRLITDTNQIIGIIGQARNTAISRKPTLLCAVDTQCKTFGKQTGNLILVIDQNNNRQQDANEPVLYQTQLHKNTRVSWRSFQNKPYLAYQPSGLAYFQNGHFLICGQKTANKVILNWVGRPYVEKANYDALCQ